MFTNNYIKFQKARFTVKDYTTSCTLKNANNETVYGYLGNSYCPDIGAHMTTAKCNEFVVQNTSTTVATNVSQGVWFGTGSTPATKADYKLESPIESGLTITNPSALVWENDGNGKHTVYADFIVRNTTDAEINIYEIGVFTPFSAKSSTSLNATGYTVNYILMERTVLDEPISILPGESKLVTYKITFNQTLNVE